MEALIGIALFFGLLVWILFDMRQIRRKPIEFRDKASGWSKDSDALKQARIFILGLSGAIYVLAAVEWMHPSAPPFTGRLAFLETALYYSFGPEAIAIFLGGIATAFAMLGFFKKHASKDER
jgi:hypothetical protein